MVKKTVAVKQKKKKVVPNKLRVAYKDDFTKRADQLIMFLTSGEVLSKALVKAGITRFRYYRKLRTDKLFKERMDVILKQVKQNLKDNAERDKLAAQDLPKFDTQRTEMTETIVVLLCDAFHGDATVLEACRYASISRSFFYSWYNKNELFKTRIDKARDNLPFASKKVIAQKIISEKDVKVAQWLLERRQPKIYSPTIRDRDDMDNEKKDIGELAEELEKNLNKSTDELFDREALKPKQKESENTEEF